MLPFCSIWLFTFSFVSNLSYNEYWHPPNLFANDFLVGLKCLDRSCTFLKETGLVQKQAGKISSRTSLKEQYMWICYQNNKLQHSKSWLIWTWFFSCYHFATNPTRWYDEWFSHGDLVDIGILADHFLKTSISPAKSGSCICLITHQWPDCWYCSWQGAQLFNVYHLP